MTQGKTLPIEPQAILDGETFADAAHRLGRDPFELVGAVLDAELRPEFERAEKLMAEAEAQRERAERPRKPRCKSMASRIKAAKANDLDVIAILSDGTVQTAPKGASDPLPANGHDQGEANPWH